MLKSHDENEVVTVSVKDAGMASYHETVQLYSGAKEGFSLFKKIFISSLVILFSALSIYIVSIMTFYLYAPQLGFGVRDGTFEGGSPTPGQVGIIQPTPVTWQDRLMLAVGQMEEGRVIEGLIVAGNHSTITPCENKLCVSDERGNSFAVDTSGMIPEKLETKADSLVMLHDGKFLTVKDNKQYYGIKN